MVAQTKDGPGDCLCLSGHVSLGLNCVDPDGLDDYEVLRALLVTQEVSDCDDQLEDCNWRLSNWKRN